MRALLLAIALAMPNLAWAQSYIPSPLGKPVFTNGVLSQPMADGSTATADSGVGSIKSAIGATTGNGHTTTAITVTFSAVAIGGSTFTQTGLADPSSGIAPGVGAKCMIGTNTATSLPLSMLFDCTVTAPGTVVITAIPRGGVALGAQSFTAHVFWWW